jgi:hypothetical protein
MQHTNPKRERALLDRFELQHGLTDRRGNVLPQFACSRKGREHSTPRADSACQFDSLNSSTFAASFGGVNVNASFTAGASTVEFL